MSKNLKIKILNKIFKKFKINPLFFAYNKIGILNWENDYESGEMFFLTNVLSKYINEDKVGILFDVGANVGTYSQTLLTIFNESKIYAFEPLPACALKLEVLKKTYGNRLFINNLGVSNQEESFEIHTYSNDLGSEHASIYSEVLTTLHKSKQVETIVCKATTIDNYCENNNIEKIDLLKIDTEGHEFNVLLGAKRMLEENRISIIQFEFNEMNVMSRIFFKDFYTLLNKDFNLFRLNKKNLEPIIEYDSILEIFKFQNFIAINKTSTYA